MKKYGALIILILLWIFIPLLYVFFALRSSFFNLEAIDLLNFDLIFPYLNIGVIILLAISALLILVLGLLIKKNVISICRWLGNAFFISGFVGLFALIMQKLVFSRNIEDFSQYPDLVTRITYEVIESFLDILFWPFAITLIIGGILLLIGYFLKSKKLKKK